MIDYLTVDDLIEINGAVLGSAAAVHDAGLVASSAMRPATIAFGVEAYTTVDRQPRMEGPGAGRLAIRAMVHGDSAISS